MLMKQKGNAINELSNPEWLFELSLLVSITAHYLILNYLIISEAVETKLKLWALHIVPKRIM